MSAARKPPAQTPDLSFSLPIPFASRKRAKSAAPPEAAVPAVPSTPASPPLPAPKPAGKPSSKRRRLSKAFDRPLDKVLRKQAQAAVSAPKKPEKSTVRDSFTLPKIEHDRLVELKTQLAQQGVSVKKSDLVRVGLILSMSISPAKLKSLLARLPPVK